MSRRYKGRTDDRQIAWRTVVSAVGSRRKKETVEDCLVLSIKELLDQGMIQQGSLRTGSWCWTDVDTFQFHGRIWYEADLRNHEKASLRLQYQVDGVSMDYYVLLTFTEPPYGGRRWWFRCPVNNIRATKLYLPPGAPRFASRQAHSLTYSSLWRPRP